jgi:hypothetical protein
LGTPPEETYRFLQEYADEAKALNRLAVQITFYMRGGVTLREAYQMSPKQRQYALQFIDENIERTNKSGVMMY